MPLRRSRANCVRFGIAGDGRFDTGRRLAEAAQAHRAAAAAAVDTSAQSLRSDLGRFQIGGEYRTSRAIRLAALPRIRGTALLFTDFRYERRTPAGTGVSC
jgi:hypothetical protein